MTGNYEDHGLVYNYYVNCKYCFAATIKFASLHTNKCACTINAHIRQFCR